MGEKLRKAVSSYAYYSPGGCSAYEMPIRVFLHRFQNFAEHHKAEIKLRLRLAGFDP